MTSTGDSMLDHAGWLDAKAGTRVTLSAAGSSDPDGTIAMLADRLAPAGCLALADLDREALQGGAEDRQRAHQFGVTVAGDGVEALRVLGSERIDVAVLDVMMPGMDGWAVLRAIRADRRLDPDRGGPTGSLPVLPGVPPPGASALAADRRACRR